MEVRMSHRNSEYRLLESWPGVSGEVSLQALLHDVVRLATEITGARYGAIGTLAPGPRRVLEEFITAGIDEETKREIGDFPIGRGLLGAVLGDSKPLRLSDLMEDPRSVGFPAGHPTMRSFLGVPLLVRGAVFGALYLTEKEGGSEFNEEDEKLVTLLASLTEAEIEKVLRYEGHVRWSGVLEALVELERSIGSELELPRILDQAASELRALISAERVVIWLLGSDGLLRVSAAAGLMASRYLDGTVGPSSRMAGKPGAVLKRGRAERVDSILDDPEGDLEHARRVNARAGIFAPIMVGERRLGVLIATNREGDDPRFSQNDLRIAELFATRAAIAVELAQTVERETLEQALQAQENERRRVASELHDGTGQALILIKMGLNAIEAAETEEERRRQIGKVRGLAVDALDDVRRLVLDLRPRVLDDFGLVAAIRRLADNVAERSGLTIEVQSEVDDRLDQKLETVLYHVVQEALTNVVKHANATTVGVELGRRRSTVSVAVRDDGEGFDAETVRQDAYGLTGMRDNLALVGGTLEIDSGPDQGTVVRAEAPTDAHAPTGDSGTAP